MRPRQRAALLVACLSAGLAAAAGAAQVSGCAAHGSVTPPFIENDTGVDAPGVTVDANLAPGDDASSILGSGCATAKAPIQRDPIYMLMVLDGSGSMLDDSKWAAIVPALEGFIDTLQSMKDTTFGLGLTIFSDSSDPTDGGPYTKMDVPIAFVDDAQAVLLHQRLDVAVPKGQTPTLAVLTGQYPLVEAYVPTPPLKVGGGHKVLVLMTDGVPYPDTATQQPKCIQAAKDEFAKAAPVGPVTTFAVGIGHTFPYDPTVYDPMFMGQLALAGGAPNQPCAYFETKYAQNMCHFQITPVGGQTQIEQDLLIAFDKIRAKVTSCDLTLDTTGIIDPGLVNVVYTDPYNTQHVLEDDPSDGWTYDNPQAPTKVVLHGQACDDLKANPSGQVEVVLGCKTIVK